MEDAAEERRAAADGLDDLPVMVEGGQHAADLALVKTRLLQQSQAAGADMRLAAAAARHADVVEQRRHAEVLPQGDGETRALGEDQRVLADAEAVQAVRGRAGRVPPELIVARMKLEQVGDHAPQRKDVHPPPFGDALPGVFDQLDTSRHDRLRLDLVGRLLGFAGRLEAVDDGGLDVVHAALDQRLP